MIWNHTPSSRATARISRREDAGVALAMTLGIMLVGAIIIAVVAAVAVSSSLTTIENREEMSAFQSADYGIDTVVSALADESHATMGDACAYEVPSTLTVNGDTVEIEMQFTVYRGSSVELAVGVCPDPGDATQRVVVYSTATAPAFGSSEGPVVRTAVAELIPVPPQIGLDKAIFSNSSVTLVSNTELKRSEGSSEADAHVYSNGGVNCSANLNAGGSIYAAQGDIIMTSGCDVDSSVWASGRVELKSSTVNGDIYAASSSTGALPAVSFEGSGVVATGSILTNGDVKLDSTGSSVSGSVFTSAGGFASNKVDVAGSVYAHNSILLTQAEIGTDAVAGVNAPGGIVPLPGLGVILGDNNNKTQVLGDATAFGTITGLKSVGGTSTPLATTAAAPNPDPNGDLEEEVGYPGKVLDPVREPLPQLNMREDDLELWSAAGWTIEKYSGYCTADVIDPLIGGGLSVGAGRLLLFEGCAAPVQVLTSNVTLTTNIALVSRSGFTNQNASDIVGSMTGGDPTLYMIVPAESVPWSGDNPSCPASELYDIRIGAFKMYDVQFFGYTPCDFDYKTSISAASEPWVGQIYAGSAFPGAGAFKLQMARVPVPSAVEEIPDLSAAANLTVVSRYDQH